MTNVGGHGGTRPTARNGNASGPRRIHGRQATLKSLICATRLVTVRESPVTRIGASVRHGRALSKASARPSTLSCCDPACVSPWGKCWAVGAT